MTASPLGWSTPDQFVPALPMYRAGHTGLLDSMPPRLVEEGRAMTNLEVRTYWEQRACGTSSAFVASDLPALSREWFEEVERVRYQLEPFIHSIAQFTRHAGERVLEIGVGAGTDHLQFARAGAILSGVDLTDTAIETTRRHLDLYGFSSDLRRVDAEQLPFDDSSFETVYSFGVIHHSEHPSRILAEAHRVLTPGGTFCGMLYHRHSVVAYRRWLQHSLKDRRLWRSTAAVIANYMESPGTKAYSRQEATELFQDFTSCRLQTIVTPWDGRYLPGAVTDWIPSRFGWYLGVWATK